jgi:hypothetical protein
MAWSTIAVSVSLVVNLSLIALYTWRTICVFRLEFLLRRVIVDAFLQRHLPIWCPWAEAFDMRISMVVREIEDMESRQ